MNDRRAPDDPNQPPEDVASLFSWANLRGARHKETSASRAQSRETTRLQNQQEAEQDQAIREAQTQQVEATRLTAEAALAQERARQAERAAEEAAQRASQLARHSAQVSTQSSEEPAPQDVSEPAAFAPQATPQPGTFAHPASNYPAGRAGAERRDPGPTVPGREKPVSAVRTPWSGPEGRERPARPAWLTERPSAPGAAQHPDTLQGSRERLTSRWFALKSISEVGAGARAETAPAPTPTPGRPPMLAVFSLAGGVGKTSIVATLGRVLSSRGERVLLVDTAVFGLLPFYFGARDQRPGELRIFTPPASSGDVPIQMISLNPGSLTPDENGKDRLTEQILQHGRGVSRVIVDLPTASGATARRILPLAAMVLVPVVPDMNSVVSVGFLEDFFERNSSAAGKPYYVLNRFDASLPLHLDVREVLRERVGERLLPFALRRAPAVSEALAEGMTIMDYAPSSTAAEDFGSLAGWVKSQSAPVMTGFRGVRWSER